MTDQTYRIAAFAKLAGVTVRTLQHYDRIGLLSPAEVTEGGHRLYHRSDLFRLQQIVTLKWMGFSLKQIGEMLEQMDIRESLRMQKQAIDHQIDGLRRAAEAIDCVLQDEAIALDAETAVTIMQGLRMPSVDWLNQYYSQPAQMGIYMRGLQYSDADFQQIAQQWANLYAGFNALRDQPADSAAVQKLAAQVHALREAFTGGDPEAEAGLSRLRSDRPSYGLPGDTDSELQQFMQDAYQLYLERNSK